MMNGTEPHRSPRVGVIVNPYPYRDNSQTDLIEMAGGNLSLFRNFAVRGSRLRGVAAPCHPEPALRLHEQAVATGEGSLHEMLCGVARR